MRTMGGRPVLMQRFPHGAEGSSFFQKRVPDNAPDWLETDDREHAERHDVARARGRRPRAHRVGGEPRLPRLPRVAVARRPIPSTPTSCASTSTRSRAPTSTKRAPPPRSRTRCSTSSASSASRRPPGTAASTCTCASQPRWDPIQVRAAAVAVARELARRNPASSPTRGGRRSGASGSSSTSTRTRRTRRSSARGACAPGRARRCRRRSTGTSSTTIDPDAQTIATVPGACRRARRSVGRDAREPQSIEPLLAMYERDLANGLHDAPWPPVYPKMPGEPPRVAPSRARKKKMPDDNE